MKKVAELLINLGETMLRSEIASKQNAKNTTATEDNKKRMS